MLLGWVLALLSVASWSATPTLVAREKRMYDSIVANGVRGLAGALALTPLYLLHPIPLSMEAIVLAFLVGVTGAVIGDGLYVAGLRRLGAGIATPISYAYIVVAQLIGFLITHDAGPLDVASSLVAVAGLYIAFHPDKARLDRLGVLYAVGSAAAWGVFVHITRYALDATDPLALNMLRLYWASLILLAYSTVARGTGYVSSAIRNLRLTTLSGVLGFGIGGSAFYASMLYLPLSTVVVVSASTPLLAQAVAAAFSGEHVKPRYYVGGAAVAVSIALSAI